MKASVLTIIPKAGLVAIMLFTVSILSATAQTPITVITDKTSYSDGDTIKISGSVADQLNIPISIVIKDSSQNLVYIAQTNPDAHNNYSSQAVAGGNLWKTAGTYEIDVTYGGQDKTAKTTFEFTGTQTQPIANTGNQTNATQAIPEFGSLSVIIFALAILTTIALSTKIRPVFTI